MSFLKISDPTKRDQTVKEYLELKKNIRNDLLSERAGEQQLQTELTKFYRPITESQKATAREITEGLRPIREAIEKLPQAKKKESADEKFARIIKELEEREKELEEREKKEEEEEDESIGEMARYYLNKSNTDKTFGIRKKRGHHYIGNKHVIVTEDDDIIIKESGDKFLGTDGVWALITFKDPQELDYDEDDLKEYERLMIKTNALHKDYDPNNPYPRSSKSDKWLEILGPIWHRKRLAEWQKKGYEGKGTVILSSDPNVLLERLDLLLASQKAGHTGVGNELVSICDELKRQGVLDTTAYKKLNSIIKNDST